MTETTQVTDDTIRGPGRPRNFDVDAALDQAIVVFSERGYHAASISELTAAMGLTPGSIYKAFGDKKGVLLSAFDRYKTVRNRLRDDAVGQGASGRDKLKRLLDFYAAASSGPAGIEGCLIVGVTTELAAVDQEAADKVRRSIATNDEFVETLIREGQADGSIRTDMDVGAAAAMIVCVQQGMRVVGKTGRSEEEMVLVVDVAMRAIG
ncbi:TetR/AcrR family transcriptional regulator [Hoeflea sp. AS60]|uniref:TetR/AcrR family transcriptional regulator n=1 Tax=Hoeflea sp. AS60 TaxID=3135780 RepID=UPI003177CED8